jgi:hypothetical protein
VHFLPVFGFKHANFLQLFSRKSLKIITLTPAQFFQGHLVLPIQRVAERRGRRRRRRAVALDRRLHPVRRDGGAVQEGAARTRSRLLKVHKLKKKIGQCLYLSFFNTQAMHIKSKTH